MSLFLEEFLQREEKKPVPRWAMEKGLTGFPIHQGGTLPIWAKSDREVHHAVRTRKGGMTS